MSSIRLRMRAWVMAIPVLLLTAALPGFVNEAHATGSRVILPWAHVGHAVFRGRVLDVPSDVMIATDGDTFFYASVASQATLTGPVSDACTNGGAVFTDSAVFLGGDSCMWAAFPAIACLGTHLCWLAAMGFTPDFGTQVMPPLSSQSVSNDDYAQFGVQKWQGTSVTAYGERTGIAMTSTSEQYSVSNEWHDRWAGLLSSANLFMQAGTAMSTGMSAGQWEWFCYGWPDGHPANSDWSYFSSGTTDTNFHYYSWRASSIGSATYECEKDFLVGMSVNAGHASFNAPLLESILELAAASPQLDPSFEHAGTDTLSPAVDYMTSSGGWLDAPSETFFASTWNSNTTIGQDACLTYSIGQTLPFSTTHDITLGSGLTCHSSGSAW